MDHHRDFWSLWSTQALSLMGSQAVQFALIWWLAIDSGSATTLASAALAGLAPQIVLGPWLGAIVDRSRRKTVMLAADAGVALASLVLAGLFAVNAVEPVHVYALLFVRSVGSGLHSPAMQAATSLMVPAEQLARIQGLNQALQGGLLLVTAPLGALFANRLPMSGVMLVDVGTALVAIATLVWIAVPEPPGSQERASSPRRGLAADLLDGVRYLRAKPGHLALVLIASSINLWLVPAFSLLPLLVADVLSAGATHYGWMSAAFGGGSLAGGMLLGVWGGFRRRIVTALAALVGLGAAVLLLGLAPAGAKWLSIAAMLAVGGFVAPVNGPILAILQATIAPEFQGRVFALLGSVAGVAAPLGLLLAAPLAEWLGVRAWFVGGGLSCFLAAAAMAAMPSILHIEDRAMGQAA